MIHTLFNDLILYLNVNGILSPKSQISALHRNKLFNSSIRNLYRSTKYGTFERSVCLGLFEICLQCTQRTFIENKQSRYIFVDLLTITKNILF